jgi:serine/threonine protein kinase
MQEVQTTLPPGSVVQERYVVEKLLGKGGFGAVYLVRDARFKQNLFALKEVIDPGKKERSRFLFEGELLKRLDHRALPRVYRLFEDEAHDRAYMLMDYVEGLNLERLRRQQPENRFSLSQVLTLIAPVIGVVSYLHKQQPPVIHRDIKPSNIILSVANGEAVLVDLGIAKEYNPDSTTTAIRRCSPGYAAPEQYRSGTSTRTDIYGLSATVYNLLTGIVPADAFHRLMQLDTEASDPLEPVNTLVPAIPQAVARVIQRAMALSSEDRFATVDQFWQELQGDSVLEPLVVPVTPQSALSAAEPAPSSRLPVPPRQTGIIPAPVTVSLQKQPGGRRFRKVTLLFLVLLALLVSSGIGMGLWLYLTTTGRPVSHSPTRVPGFPATATLAASTPTAHPTVNPTVRSSTPTVVVVTPRSTTIPVNNPAPGPPHAKSTPTPHPTPTPAPIVYAKVSGSYSGSIDDTTANITTSMALSVQQEPGEGEISGRFTVGAPLVGNGPFTGTVATNKYIQFTVPRHKNIAPLFFYGWVQADGSLKGNYCSLNDQNQCDPAAGAGGTWDVTRS